MINMNTPDYIRKIRETVRNYLKTLEHAPSVQMQQVPTDHYSDEELEDDHEKDVRITQHDRDVKVARENEIDDSDDEEGPGGRRMAAGDRRRRNQVQYKEVSDDEVSVGGRRKVHTRSLLAEIPPEKPENQMDIDQ
jgi:histone deacetylase 1/2